MNCFIITGTSRGLGAAIVKQIISPDNQIHCISRTPNEQIKNKAEQSGSPLFYHLIDLNDTTRLETLFDTIFSSLDPTSLSSICLINNAGILKPIKPIDQSESDQIVSNIHVNLVAPILLSSLFIKKTTDWQIKKRIINISSGAGQKPHYGWSTYCSAKSGLDIFTRCVAIEQQERKYPVEIISFTPGIIDTDMQQEIRNSSKEDFKEHDKFVKYKIDGKLLSPDLVAEKVLQLALDSELQQGSIYDIMELI